MCVVCTYVALDAKSSSMVLHKITPYEVHYWYPISHERSWGFYASLPVCCFSFHWHLLKSLPFYIKNIVCALLWQILNAVAQSGPISTFRIRAGCHRFDSFAMDWRTSIYEQVMNNTTSAFFFVLLSLLNELYFTCSLIVAFFLFEFLPVLDRRQDECDTRYSITSMLLLRCLS